MFYKTGLSTDIKSKMGATWICALHPVASNYAASAMHAMTRIRIIADVKNMANGVIFSDLSVHFFCFFSTSKFKCQKVRSAALNGNYLTRIFCFLLLIFASTSNSGEKNGRRSITSKWIMSIEISLSNHIFDVENWKINWTTEESQKSRAEEASLIHLN